MLGAVFVFQFFREKVKECFVRFADNSEDDGSLLVFM
jgi:hypothetical protein